MQIPIMTNELALQVEKSKSDHLESWIRGMQQYTGNPFGANLLQVQKVNIFAARHLQEIGLFNAVIGLGPQNKDLLPEIIRFYREHEIEHYHLEINPHHATSDFLATLAANGFTLSAFQTYSYGLPLQPLLGPLFPSIIVRDVSSSEVDLFADLHVGGFREALSHVPEQTFRLYRECTKVLYGLPGWFLYLVLINNIPSGMGMLYIQDSMALLAGGATLPSLRGQGGQTASLQHRLVVAAEVQCALVSGQTRVGSKSQQNMERLGMRTAYTGTIWTRH